LAFGFGVGRVRLDLLMDDPDGAELLWFTEHPPVNGYELAQNIEVQFTDYHLEAATWRYTPEINIKILQDTEKMVRLLDELLQGRLCLHIHGEVEILLQKPGRPTVAHSQHVEIPAPLVNIFGGGSVVVTGDSDCEKPERCTGSDYIVVVESTEDFSVNFSAVGSTSFQQNTARLTDGASSVGAVWTKSKYSVLDTWEVEFQFQAVNVNMVNTDGFVFSIQSQSKDALGSSCLLTRYCHGYQGIGSSVGIVVDFNLEQEILVFENGDTGSGALTYDKVSGASISDGGWHSMKLAYNSAVGRLWLYVTNMSVPLMYAGLNMSSYANNKGKAWLGFTASSGILGFSTRFQIRNFEFRSVETHAETSLIQNADSVVGVAGEEVLVVILVARTACKHRRRAGGDEWFVSLSTAGHEINLSSIAGDISDLGDGRYSIQFTTAVPGTYTVAVALAETHSKAVVGQVVISSP